MKIAAVIGAIWTITLVIPAVPAFAAVDSIYQWSVQVAPPQGDTHPSSARAYLWIPEQCQRVRAVVVGQQNMLEEDILDHPDFRRAMAELNVAIVWVSPSMDARVATPQAAARFDGVLADLAKASGYAELATAPMIPIGHSAHASYPWNFAAWEPARTVCLLSIHGDGPQTPIAGFGRQHIVYPDGALDGVPGLMVMGQYEWIDARWAPATVYRCANPQAPITLLADVGQGHFAACDDLVNFCAMFIRKCMELRVPPVSAAAPDAPPVLKAVNPMTGWLVQRWEPGIGRTIAPAPYREFGGNAWDAFWASDREMAEAIQNYRAGQNGKEPQLLGFVQDGKEVPFTNTAQMVNLKFEPGHDGESFTLKPVFLSVVPKFGNCAGWAAMPGGSPIGHASGGGDPTVVRIEGPVLQTGPDSFRLAFYRGCGFGNATVWFAAMQPGDGKYRSAVQQAEMNIPRCTEGPKQTITFPPVADVAADTATVQLNALSSAGLPVQYYVREGPAAVEGNSLKILPAPPRSAYPIAVTVVAWQWGRSGADPVQTAEPVERTFHLLAK